MGGIRVEMSEESYRAAADVLNPDELRKALYQAVKRTTGRGTTIARKEVQRVLNLTKKYVDRAIATRLEIHDPDPPVGLVQISERRLPAIAYNPTIGERGVRFKTWKGGTRADTKVFAHGFKATVNKQNAKVDSEFHTGVFIRTRHLPTKGPNAGKGKLTPEGFAGRLAIKQLMAPSVYSSVSLPKVEKAITDGLHGELDKQLQSQIDYRISKRK